MNPRITAIVLCLWFLALYSAGCTQATVATIPPSFSASDSSTNRVVTTETPQPASVPTSQSLTPHPVSISSQSEEILEFTFPEPAQAPVSLWRPPLYEAPFALGPYDHFYFQRPIAADEINWPLANYRYGGVFWENVVHSGIDIVAKRGTPVIAAGPGEVISAGYGVFSGGNDPNDPYGLAVTIQHDFGYKGRRLYTIYGHMDRVDAVVGQRVNTGDPIGIVGNTGKTTGPHLHFEVRIANNSFFTSRNPELWIVPPQGWGVLVGLLQNTNGSFLGGQRVDVRSKQSGDEWYVISYGGQSVIHSDAYYKENLVLGDLPAGDYYLFIKYFDDIYVNEIRINPGAITYFTFTGEKGYSNSPPPTPSPDEFLNP